MDNLLCMTLFCKGGGHWLNHLLFSFFFFFFLLTFGFYKFLFYGDSMTRVIKYARISCSSDYPVTQYLHVSQENEKPLIHAHYH